MEETATDLLPRLGAFGWTPGAGLGVAEGTIAGNRPDALLAPISELEMTELAAPLTYGTGPSGSAVPGRAPAGELAAGADAEGTGADAEGAGVAAVTATVAVADGGVHFAAVATLAVAVNFTEVTEVASAATGICACRTVGCVSDRALTVHVAVPPLAQPLVNVGF